MRFWAEVEAASGRAAAGGLAVTFAGRDCRGRRCSPAARGFEGRDFRADGSTNAGNVEPDTNGGLSQATGWDCRGVATGVLAFAGSDFRPAASAGFG